MKTSKGKIKPQKQNNAKKSRKDIRQAKRLAKKAKRNEYYTNRNKIPGPVVPDENSVKPMKPTKRKSQPTNVAPHVKESTKPIADNSSIAKCVEKEKKVHNELKAVMNKQRHKQMIEANWEEDKNIKKLEKQLKLNKRKTKSIPKTFAEDGLDCKYLIDIFHYWYIH